MDSANSAGTDAYENRKRDRQQLAAGISDEQRLKEGELNAERGLTDRRECLSGRRLEKLTEIREHTFQVLSLENIK